MNKEKKCKCAALKPTLQTAKVKAPASSTLDQKSLSIYLFKISLNKWCSRFMPIEPKC